ncbi:MAG TPA: potassium channel protein, partial [Caldithrix abyssi]|nr:potassium channel protein [Caldithrix abyssi]
MSEKPFKYLPDSPLNLLLKKTSRRNALLLLNLLAFTTLLIILYAILFQFVAAYEGDKYDWFTGIYWTLEIMSTLGTGDIVFTSGLGRFFTVLVLLTGVGFILVIIPFVFLQLFQSTARVPREIARAVEGHVIITQLDEISMLLVEKFRDFGQEYVLLCEQLEKAQLLIDEGYRVIHGSLNNPRTYEASNVHRAALVVLTGNDERNTALLHAIRHTGSGVPVISTALNIQSGSILRQAGATRVLTVEEMLGETMARRVSGGDALAHLVGRIDNLIIAEATMAGTPLVGKTLREINLRALTGLTVVGIWEKGRFQMARADSVISPQSAVVLAGSRDQIQAYNEMFCIYNTKSKPVLIIGAGVVGRATADFLERRSIECKLLELDNLKVKSKRIVQGDARDLNTLIDFGLEEAPTIVLTTRDDNRNIYLTTLIRKTNPHIQIISRATEEASTLLLHRAGADFVISYASIGATSIFNFLKGGDILMVTEGVDVFRVRVPDDLAGRTIAETTIRKEFGLSIIGINR